MLRYVEPYMRVRSRPTKQSFNLKPCLKGLRISMGGAYFLLD